MDRLPPSPTCNESEPPAPLFDDPVCTESEPELPASDRPEEMDTSPDTLFDPDADDSINVVTNHPRTDALDPMKADPPCPTTAAPP